MSKNMLDSYNPSVDFYHNGCPTYYKSLFKFQFDNLLSMIFEKALRKVVEHNVMRRKVLRGHAPLATDLIDVEYAVHDVSKRIFSLSCR